MNITAFGHAGIKVRDLQVSERFYASVLNLPIARRQEAMGQVNFRIGDADQFLVQAVGADAQAPADAGPGLHHIAFVVGNTRAALDDAALSLDRHQVRYERTVHDDFESLFFHDPDGHLVELYYWPSW